MTFGELQRGQCDDMINSSLMGYHDCHVVPKLLPFDAFKDGVTI